jgi:3',5'-cyclic-AMP phosphodiesterase
MIAALAAPKTSSGQDASEDRWILVSDSHIAADPNAKRSDVTMADNFKRVAADLVKEASRYAGVIHHGDLAYSTGEKRDYDTFGTLLQPISMAGLPVHLLLGNHDHRDHFLEGFGLRKPEEGSTGGRHAAIVEGSKANFFLLDTLEFVNGTPGLLGDQQLKWLSSALDGRKNKPAIVCMHHNPEFAKVKKISGLKDTDALWRILAPRTQVKALVYGHTHHWSHTEKDGVHCVNLPPTAYVFQERDPNGWVELTMSESGGRFKLHALDPKHKANGQVLDLKWR